MSIVSIRDLRLSFPKVEAMLRNGEEVWIARRGKPFARLVPGTLPPAVKPDFKARFGPDSPIKPIKIKGGLLQDFLRWREEER